MPGYTLEQRAPDVLVVRDNRVAADWEQWYLLRADAHWDNPLCDRKLYKRHMDQARERSAGIIHIGDLFCLMQGKYDPRADKSSVRPEHNCADYLGAVEDDAVAQHEPYKDLFVLISDGNHETAILKRHEYNILRRFCRRLGVPHGSYAGWILFRFQAVGGGRRRTVRLFYHHGSGGGGPVTKGTLWPVKHAAIVPDADIVIGGHIHEQWLFPIERDRVSDAGVTYLDKQYHLCLPTYKQEYTHAGFHTERGRPPKPLGAWWLKFYYQRDKPGSVGIHFEMAES